MKSRSKSGPSFQPIFEYKIAYDGGIKNFALYFCEKIFSIFRTEFERNLNRFLRFFKIEIANIKSQPTGVKKNFTYIPWVLN